MRSLKSFSIKSVRAYAIEVSEKTFSAFNLDSDMTCDEFRFMSLSDFSTLLDSAS